MIANMESNEQDGLFVQFDEESSTFTFEWDDETHPEYNFLRLLSPEELMNALSERLEELIQHESDPDVQRGGSGGGTPEIYDHPQPQE